VIRRRTFLAGLAAGWALRPARAEPLVTEVLPLGHRTLEEILPVLRPLVPEPGRVTGLGSQLVVRTTPANLTEIRAVLAELDAPPRSLLVSLRRRAGRSLERDGASLSGRLESGAASGGVPDRLPPGGAQGSVSSEGGSASVRVYRNRGRLDEHVLQQVRVLEGRPARLHMGSEVPVGSRMVWTGPGGQVVQDMVRYRGTGDSLWVVPRVRGDQVVLEVSSASARLAPSHGGVFDESRARSQVSGPLGAWIPLAAAQRQADARSRGQVYRAGDRRGREIALEVKVEIVPAGRGPGS
jgi:hypothetical protein